MDENEAKLIPLDAVDPAMVEELLDRAFGTERQARTAYRVREGMDWLPAVSFAALDSNDLLVGTIQGWPVGLFDDEKRGHPMVMTGPVAVVPERQSEGFGKALVIAHNAAMGDSPSLPQVMIGDPEYYGRFFGFSADHTGDWRLPGPFDSNRLLCRCVNPAILPHSGMLGPWSGPLAK